MTDNERELLNIIRNSNNPERALELALNIIVDFLTPPESFREPSSACPPECA